MRIIRLEASNVKRLKAVAIEPQGPVTVVGGRNAAGKTSVLDAIAIGLGGHKLAPPRLLREGQDKAEIQIELDDGLLVTRSETADGKRQLVVQRKRNGAPERSPQRVLDALLGQRAFDPTTFNALRPREQYETLCELIGIDLDNYHAARKKIYDERTVVSREAKQARIVADEAERYPEAPEAPLDMATVQAELQAAYKQNREVDEWESNIANQRDAIAELGESVATLTATIERLQKQLFEQQATLTERRAKLMELANQGGKQRRDPTALEKRCAELSQINAKVAANQRAEALDRSAEECKAKADDLTLRIDRLDREVERQLEQAHYPLDGLGVAEGYVTLNGLPLEQASSAEQLRVSVAIACALNPTLRVMLVRDGSLLDDDSMRLLAELAEQYDAQVWVERVGDGDAGAVIIEDGLVRAAQ